VAVRLTVDMDYRPEEVVQATGRAWGEKGSARESAAARESIAEG